jgi:serine/threonine protein kinase/tetratricopeptide (TPR) repeat protein
MKPPGAAQLPNDAGETAEEKECLHTSPEPGPLPAKVPTVPDYELLQRIGSGAYGEVWLARSKATGALRAAKIVWRHRFEDERPYQREFEGIQKFERISREHPSQLALFHIGRNEAEGYFYYVMELADAVQNPKSQIGNPRESRTPKSEETSDNEQILARHAAARPGESGVRASDSYAPHTLRADLAHGRLPAARVLELGLALAEALAHLHRHGLVHRDVKPSNVIFAHGRPKLADIGLVTDASDTCSIVGTEGYLPPEGPGTPRADLFALGKVLYEAAMGLDRREFPKLPSEIRTWPDKRLVFELNEIVLKCCADDTRERYQSVEVMQADLLLLSAGRSVRQTHSLERRLKLTRRVALATAAVMVLGVIPYALAIREARIARANEKRAIAQSQVAEAVTKFVEQDLLGQADIGSQDKALRALGRASEVKANPTIKELLDRAAAELAPGKIEQRFPEQREVQASLLTTVGDAYMATGDANKAVQLLTRADALYHEIRPADHPESLDASERLAQAYGAAGDWPRAVKLLEQVRDTRVKKFGTNHAETLVAQRDLARAYSRAGRRPEALALLERVHDAQAKQLGLDDPNTLGTLASLAGAYEDTGDRRALQLFKEVRDKRAARLGADNPATLVSVNDLALASLNVGQPFQAVELYEQVREAFDKKFGPDHPNTLIMLNNLAQAYRESGKPTQAIELLEHVRELQAKKLGPEHTDTLVTQHSLAKAYRAAGKLPEAIELLERLREVRTRKFGLGDPSTLDTLDSLAGAYEFSGRVPQALELLNQVLEAKRKQFGPENPGTLVAENNLAVTYIYARKPTQALPLLEHAHAGFLQTIGTNHPNYLRNLGCLALAYQDTGRLAEAIPLLEQTRDQKARLLGADHPETLSQQHNLAGAYKTAGHPERALVLWRQAAEAMEKKKFQDQFAWTIVGNLISTLIIERQPEEAETWYRRWLALVPEAPDYGAALSELAQDLGGRQAWMEAEVVLREAVNVYQKTQPDSWLVFYNQSRLGKALVNQKCFAEAEPFLLTGLQGLEQRQEQIPNSRNFYLMEAYDNAAQLYDAWGKEPPDTTSTRSGPFLRARAGWLARRGNWQPAAAELGLLLDRAPEYAFAYHMLASVLVASGDRRAHYQLCQRMLTLGATTNAYVAYCVAKDCLILPSGPDLLAASKLAETANKFSEAKAGADLKYPPLYRGTKALADYRQGRFASAVEWARKSLDPHYSGGDCCFVEACMIEAMAQFRMQQLPAAQTALTRGLERASELPRLERGDLGPGWQDWVTAHALMAEATSLLNGGLFAQAPSERDAPPAPATPASAMPRP